jgi:hypothetical protein
MDGKNLRRAFLFEWPADLGVRLTSIPAASVLLETINSAETCFPNRP